MSQFVSPQLYPTFGIFQNPLAARFTLSMYAACAISFNFAPGPSFSLYGLNRSLIWSQAFFTAMPFRSEPEDAAVGDALAI